MSYDKDQTYLNLAHQALEVHEPVLRDVPEIIGMPAVEPTPWGDPQFVLRVSPGIAFERLQAIREMVSGEPIVPVVFKFVRES